MWRSSVEAPRHCTPTKVDLSPLAWRLKCAPSSGRRGRKQSILWATGLSPYTNRRCLPLKVLLQEPKALVITDMDDECAQQCSPSSDCCSLLVSSVTACYLRKGLDPLGSPALVQALRRDAVVACPEVAAYAAL
jgi:hypothetical protein